MLNSVQLFPRKFSVVPEDIGCTFSIRCLLYSVSWLTSRRWCYFVTDIYTRICRQNSFVNSTLHKSYVFKAFFFNNLVFMYVLHKYIILLSNAVGRRVSLSNSEDFCKTIFYNIPTTFILCFRFFVVN